MKAKEFLSQRGIPYVEKDVSRDRQAAMEMIRLSGQQGVPVIAVDDQVIVGFNRPRLEQLLAARPPAGAPGQRRALGALVGNAADPAFRRLGLPPSGAYVGGVRPGSPAEIGGLHTGDVIVAVNGRDVQTADDLERALATVMAGSQATIRYVRGGGIHHAQIAL